jgi:hypothetical protein
MASNDPKPDTANNKPENASDDARADVTAAVEELLNSLSNKFAGVSSEIFAKSELVHLQVLKVLHTDHASSSGRDVSKIG